MRQALLRCCGSVWHSHALHTLLTTKTTFLPHWRTYFRNRTCSRGTVGDTDKNLRGYKRLRGIRQPSPAGSCAATPRYR